MWHSAVAQPPVSDSTSAEFCDTLVALTAISGKLKTSLLWGMRAAVVLYPSRAGTCVHKQDHIFLPFVVKALIGN